MRRSSMQSRAAVRQAGTQEEPDTQEELDIQEELANVGLYCSALAHHITAAPRSRPEPSYPADLHS
jgi:hypothetical protein